MEISEDPALTLNSTEQGPEGGTELTTEQRTKYQQGAQDALNDNAAENMSGNQATDEKNMDTTNVSEVLSTFTEGTQSVTDEKDDDKNDNGEIVDTYNDEMSTGTRLIQELTTEVVNTGIQEDQPSLATDSTVDSALVDQPDKIEIYQTFPKLNKNEHTEVSDHEAIQGVSGQDLHVPPPLPEGVQKLKRELERMNEEDEKIRKAEKDRYRREVAKLKSQLAKAKTKQRIASDWNTDIYKKFIADEMAKEEVLALKAEQEKENEQTRQIARELDKKHAITERRKAGNADRLIKKLEKDAKRPPRQDEVTRELTREEKEDLHIAFDMFDKKRRGMISVSDLKRLGKMLYLPVQREPLKGMISQWDKAKHGVVEFGDFLQLVVAAQGDGPDPYEEIVQGFHLMDTEGKGYVTFEDLRHAADQTDAVFSNTMLRDMMTEADCTGDGRISQREFVRIMLDTNRYRVIKKALSL